MDLYNDTMMRAVLPQGDANGMPLLGELPTPRVGQGEVRVAVVATALNRADLLQLRGLYPPPPGESAIPGLECAGTIVELGPGVMSWKLGDRVMALLAGGGQAEQVVVPTGQLLAVPAALDLVTAAALPEALVTAWLNLAQEGELSPGESVLITAAASGVGALAVQVARELGAGQILVAGRNKERLERLLPLGATAVVSLGEGFAERVRAANGGRGVDLVFEMVGGEQLANSLAALAPRGRLVLVGVLGGTRATLDLTSLLRQRQKIFGSVLRPRSRDEKAAIVAAVDAFAQPRLADGRLLPVLDRVLPFERIAEGYAALAASAAFGKVVVQLG